MMAMLQRLGTATLMLGIFAGSAGAQTRLEPSAALGCLWPADEERGEPDYPLHLYKRQQKGRVKAQVEFPGGPLGGPKVTVLESQGDADFVTSVERYLDKLRAPCLNRGETASITFDFVFDPVTHVVWSTQDADSDRRKTILACMQSTKDSPRPEYPDNARRRNLQARVLARITFSAPDAPPEVELFHRPSAAPLAESVRTWIAGLRLPCHTGAPITATKEFVFVMERDAYGFRPLALPQLLSVTKDIAQQRLQLDTGTMGCPFQLRFVYRRPGLPNAVGEVGAADPRRRTLLSWLAGVELDLPEKTLDAVYGDSTELAVPCLKIDLTPKEKTS